MRGAPETEEDGTAESEQIGWTPPASPVPSLPLLLLSWRGKRVVVWVQGFAGGGGSQAASDSAGGEALFKSAPAHLRRRPPRGQSLAGGWARGCGWVGRTSPRRRPRTRGAPCFAGPRLGVTRIARRRARAVRGAHPTDGGGPGKPGTTTGDIL